LSALVIKNGNILLPNGEIQPGDLLIEDGSIRDVGGILAADSELDASGAYVLPGLIDIHTHGLGRENAGFGSLAELAKIEASFGATTFYPTLFGPPSESAEHMLRHRRETDDLQQAPNVGGFRLESPYLAYPSGGTPGDCAPISPETTKALLEAGGGHVRIWDISPELDGASDAIRELSSQGIVCSIAHTRATIEQSRAAVDAGARLVTHLFDVFPWPEQVDPDPDVYPLGLVDYLLIEDRVVCEIIGDGIHVFPILVEKAMRCKTPNRIAFITDSNMGAGLPPGRYSLPGGWGDILVQGSNDGLRLPDRDMVLVGSALTPIAAFRNAVRLFGKDMATASKLCSQTPARLMGLNKGEIAAGRDADLIVLDSDLNLLYTICGGAVIHRR
jgi:N-acetylglucosamine-6-phosphate deacetylase